MTQAGDSDGDTGEPRIGEPLPRAGDAYIEREKLVAYALDEQHPVGKHKAAVFRQTLGIERDDSEYLRDSILEALPERPVTGIREPDHAGESYTWEVLVPIQGLGNRAERRLLVITAWEMVDGRPQLVTLRVAPRNRQQTGASG
jgi:hypothetical protein